ncbi:uncharacterized protein C16orf46 homolog [Salarias fasciatus]|uniref:uncharacterized protein C16orf46 homolog n=1 Tax=Salarias fasciatus TaxID=181472 RepID=UPI001176E966|nr:uncharacterized protein LOC115390881 [Salarias fasciatus]
MEICEEDDLTPVDREEGDPTDSVEQQPIRTPVRTHVDVLLDISEENLLKELEPYEYHCYSSWEDSVCGWARVAPLSCIYVTEKKCKKPNNKEADDPTCLSAGQTRSDAGSPAGSETHVDVHKPNKSSLLNQQKVLWSQMDASAQQSHAPEQTAVNTMQRNMEHLLIGEKEEFGFQPTHLQPQHSSSIYSLLDNRPAKQQKYSHRPSDTVVPITNFTFLPPIKSPELSPKVRRHLCRGKSSERESFEKNCFTLHKKNGKRGTRVDTLAQSDLYAHSTELSSRYQRNQFLSAIRASIPKRYQVPVSSKLETVHRTSYSMGKRISQAIAQPYIRPSCLFS